MSTMREALLKFKLVSAKAVEQVEKEKDAAERRAQAEATLRTKLEKERERQAAENATDYVEKLIDRQEEVEAKTP